MAKTLKNTKKDPALNDAEDLWVRFTVFMKYSVVSVVVLLALMALFLL